MALPAVPAGHPVKTKFGWLVVVSVTFEAVNFRRMISIALPWDAESLGEWAGALEDVDVLINFTGRSVNCRYNAGNRREILESRQRSTEVLGEAIRGLAHPPKVWMNASTATIYRHCFDRAMDETSGEIGGREADAPPKWRFSIDVATQWEASFFGMVTPRTRKVACITFFSKPACSVPGGG